MRRAVGRAFVLADRAGSVARLVGYVVLALVPLDELGSLEEKLSWSSAIWDDEHGCLLLSACSSMAPATLARYHCIVHACPPPSVLRQFACCHGGELDARVAASISHKLKVSFGRGVHQRRSQHTISCQIVRGAEGRRCADRKAVSAISNLVLVRCQRLSIQYVFHWSEVEIHGHGPPSSMRDEHQHDGHD